MHPRPKYRVTRKAFTDDHVDVTDTFVGGCIFDGCVVVYNAEGTTCFAGCAFRNCKLVGSGWTPRIVSALLRTRQIESYDRGLV